MTLESILFSELAAICPRAFPDVAPVDTPRPYLTYQQIGGEAITFVDNAVPSKENGEFQITSWADTRKEAKEMIMRIEAALTVSTVLQARPLAAAASDYDEDMERYGSRQDFSIWADR